MVTISLTNLRDEWANIEIEITAEDDEIVFDNTAVMPGQQTVTIEDIGTSEDADAQ